MNKHNLILPGSPEWYGQEAGPRKLILPDGTYTPEATPTEAHPSPEVGHEVTINDLAKKYLVQPKSLRSKLRKAGFSKKGKTWGWSKGDPELVLIDRLFNK